MSAECAEQMCSESGFLYFPAVDADKRRFSSIHVRYNGAAIPIVAPPSVNKHHISIANDKHGKKPLRGRHGDVKNVKTVLGSYELARRTVVRPADVEYDVSIAQNTLS